MERMRILDPAPDRRDDADPQPGARTVPALRKTTIIAAWAGYIDSTPDGVPGIGEMQMVPASCWRPAFPGMASASGPAPAI